MEGEELDLNGGYLIISHRYKYDNGLAVTNSRISLSDTMIGDYENSVGTHTIPVSYTTDSGNVLQTSFEVTFTQAQPLYETITFSEGSSVSIDIPYSYANYSIIGTEYGALHPVLFISDDTSVASTSYAGSTISSAGSTVRAVINGINEGRTHVSYVLRDYDIVLAEYDINVIKTPEPTPEPVVQPADYTAVNTAKANVPSDEELAQYTDESVERLKAAAVSTAGTAVKYSSATAPAVTAASVTPASGTTTTSAKTGDKNHTFAWGIAAAAAGIAGIGAAVVRRRRKEEK